MKNIIFIAITIVLLIGHLQASSNGNKIQINENNNFNIAPVSYNEQGILKLKISFDFNKQKVLYSWKGHIYPFLGIGLFYNVETSNFEKVRIEQVKKIMPIVPHPLDVVDVAKYEYPEVLSLKIVKEDGEPYTGCLTFSLLYNTEKFENSTSKLSKMNIKSNVVTVCNNKD